MLLPADQVTTEEVRSWTGLHLLHFQSSTCSQKVRILLREKGLAWTSHPINLAAQKHVTPWFLGINPRGVVPVLVHDGRVHVESNDILAYLDALPSELEPFFPQDESESAAVQEDLALEDSLHMDLRNLTMGFLMPYRLAKKSEATLDRWEAMEYHAGRTGIKTVGFTVKVSSKSPLGEAEATGQYRFDGKKSTLKWDNAGLGNMLASRGWSRLTFDRLFIGDSHRRALQNTELSAKKNPDGSATLTVKGKTQGGYKSFPEHMIG